MCIRDRNIVIPSDISSAAFWMVLGSCHPDAEILLPNIGLNPNRTGILEVLIEMGANITVNNKTTDMGEPRGDILVKSSKLKGINIDKNIIPLGGINFSTLSSANRIEELTQGSIAKANLMFSTPRKPWGFDGW